MWKLGLRPQFFFWESINGIFFEVCDGSCKRNSEWPIAWQMLLSCEQLSAPAAFKLPSEGNHWSSSSRVGVLVIPIVSLSADMPGNLDIDETGSWPTRMSNGKFMGKPLETDLTESLGWK
jgi:hypothetical protein